MPRLPKPGSDTGQWGDILNEYLAQAHTADGSLKDNTVGTTQLQDGSVTETHLASSLITAINTTPTPGPQGASVSSVSLDENTLIFGLDSGVDLDPITIPTIAATPSSLTVGAGKEFATIQDAIDAAKDTSNFPVTIYVYPGTYSRFSMVGSPYVAGNGTIAVRHLSLVGVNSIPGDVIVRDDSGDYRTPPAKISTYGRVENMVFIATHDNPFTDATEEAKARRSYAVHMEFGIQEVTFINCEMISMHAPAVGMGMYAGETVKFERCTMQSFADGTYGGLLRINMTNLQKILSVSSKI